MAQIFVVFAHRTDADEAAAAFTVQADAESYRQRQVNLERQRHGARPAATWCVKALQVDQLK